MELLHVAISTSIFLRGWRSKQGCPPRLQPWPPPNALVECRAASQAGITINCHALVVSFNSNQRTCPATRARVLRLGSIVTTPGLPQTIDSFALKKWQLSSAFKLPSQKVSLYFLHDERELTSGSRSWGTFNHARPDPHSQKRTPLPANPIDNEWHNLKALFGRYKLRLQGMGGNGTLQCLSAQFANS